MEERVEEKTQRYQGLSYPCPLDAAPLSPDEMLSHARGRLAVHPWFFCIYEGEGRRDDGWRRDRCEYPKPSNTRH